MSKCHLPPAPYRPENARRKPEKASAPFCIPQTLKKSAAQAATQRQAAVVE